MTKPERDVKVGDRVRFLAWGSIGKHVGTVTKVTPMARPVGGATARLRVKWDDGPEMTVEDRAVEIVETT